jgi:hypothetical protein
MAGWRGTVAARRPQGSGSDGGGGRGDGGGDGGVTAVVLFSPSSPACAAAVLLFVFPSSGPTATRQKFWSTFILEPREHVLIYFIPVATHRQIASI